MGKKRKEFSGAFKARVTLEAIREVKTAAQIASEFQVHPVQVARWKKQTVEGLPEVLEDGRGTAKSREQTPSERDLYEQIGRLHTELDWLKKNVNKSISLVQLIDRKNPDISVSRQYELLGLARSNIYYKPVLPTPDELERMAALDKRYTEFSFYGSRRIAFALTQKGFPISRSHVRRLMSVMEIEAVYARPRLSKPEKPDVRFPYLLKDIPIAYPN